MAVVLIAGVRALSWHSALALWALRAPWHGVVHASGTHCRTGPGYVIHRTNHLPPDDVTVHWGTPVTTPLRTLLDLARLLSLEALDAALAEALVRRLVTLEQLEARATGKLRRPTGSATSSSKPRATASCASPTPNVSSQRRPRNGSACCSAAAEGDLAALGHAEPHRRADGLRDLAVLHAQAVAARLRDGACDRARASRDHLAVAQQLQHAAAGRTGGQLQAAPARRVAEDRPPARTRHATGEAQGRP